MKARLAFTILLCLNLVVGIGFAYLVFTTACDVRELRHRIDRKEIQSAEDRRLLLDTAHQHFKAVVDRYCDLINSSNERFLVLSKDLKKDNDTATAEITKRIGEIDRIVSGMELKSGTTRPASPG